MLNSLLEAEWNWTDDAGICEICGFLIGPASFGGEEVCSWCDEGITRPEFFGRYDIKIH